MQHGLGRELEGLDLKAIVPVSAWLRDRPWRYPWVWWLVFFAFFPLVFATLDTGNDLRSVAWAFGLYFACFWAVLLWLCLQPRQAVFQTALRVVPLTALSLILYMAVMRVFPYPFDALDFFLESRFLPVRATAYILGVGLVEEIIKSWVLWRRYVQPGRYIEVRRAAYLAVLCGLTFGVIEAVQYSLSYAAKSRAGVLGESDYLVAQLLRLISLPLLHALFSGIVGFFIGFATWSRRHRRVVALVGLAVAAVLHGLYDATTDSPVHLLIAVFTMLLFLCYARTADRVEVGLRGGGG